MTTNSLKHCLFVVGRQRSGTTVLREALATHARVEDLGEVMHDRRKSGFYAELATRLAENAPTGAHRNWFDVLIAAIGHDAPPHDEAIRLIDIKYNMALAFGSTFVGPEMVNTFALKLCRRQGSVIHIIRRNKLALITSLKVASKTKQWGLKAGEQPRFEKIELDPGALQSRIASEEAMDAYFAAQLARAGRKITVVYEELFQPDGRFVQDCFDQVAQQFGLDDTFDLAPRRMKQGLALADSIANFDAIATQVENLVARGALPPTYLGYLQS
jgi:LPS sulfotransferase NodH